MTPQTYCPICAAALTAGAEFCGSCGTRVASAQPASSGVAGGDYAGFWIRLLAFIIDVLILSIPYAVIEVMLEGTGAQLLLRLLIGALYNVGFWVVNDGATPGKMVMGIRVVMVNGGSIDAGPALLRWIGYYVSAIIFFIGYIMIAFTREKRGLHDYMAGTVVIKTR
jgi:uncharacterized RDD family membrane protein YckC